MPADLFAGNAAYVESFKHGDLAIPPAQKLAVVACMDARHSVEASLGLKEGDAHIIRNAGGRASEAVRSLIISQQLLGTNRVAIIHHTDCGMLTFKPEQLRAKVAATLGEDKRAALDAIAFLPFESLEGSVRDDVRLVQDHPLLKSESVTGYIYDVKTGKIAQVA